MRGFTGTAAVFGGGLVALAAGLAGWFDPLHWAYRLPAPYADLVLNPVALAGQAVFLGIVVALILETFAWLARGVSTSQLRKGTTAGWAFDRWQELFPRRMERWTRSERESMAKEWLAECHQAVFGRWRWYFLLATAPAVSTFVVGLNLLSRGSGSLSYWDYFLLLAVGTGETVAAAVVALSVLMLAGQVLTRLVGRVLTLENERAAQVAQPVAVAEENEEMVDTTPVAVSAAPPPWESGGDAIGAEPNITQGQNPLAGRGAGASSSFEED